METRECTKCGVERPLTTGFYKKRDGRDTHCKKCRNEYRMSRPRSKNYKQTNLDSYYRNPEPYRVARAKRRASELQRIPKWADPEFESFFFREAYELAKLLEEATGVKHELDHIVPLQGETVSGFHVSYNIQVIPQHENRSKGNKLE